MELFGKRPMRKKASRFKGVTPRFGRWGAEFCLGKGVKLALGIFNTEEQAAAAYDEAVRRYRGPDSFQNGRDLHARTEAVIEGECASVPLNSGQRFLIDIKDLPLVEPYYWCHRSKDRGVHTHDNDFNISLYRLLLGELPENHTAIHLNGDHFDYRRSNLTVIPKSARAARTAKKPGGNSIYKGVERRNSLWRARVARTHVGYFSTEVEAALAYDEAARQRYGAFASLNFPREGELACRQESLQDQAA